MRILLVLDRVENPASANALMGFRLAEQLLRRDHTVHILTLWDGLHTPPAPPEGAMQHLLAFADERQMNEALENGQKGGTPVPLRLARLAAHPAAAAAAFRQLVLKQPRRTVDSLREIERLDTEFHFDAVCAVCAPYRTAFALEAAAIRGKKFLWQLDPYASNRDYTAPGGFAREGQLLDALDGTFVTPQALPGWPRGGKRYTFWAFQRCCRGSWSRWNTTIYSVFSAAACTPVCGSPALRWRCSAHCTTTL